MLTNSNHGSTDQSTNQILAAPGLREVVESFLRLEDPEEHIERINDLLIHRLVYTDEHDLPQKHKQNYQYTYMVIRDLIVDITKAVQVPGITEQKRSPYSRN